MKMPTEMSGAMSQSGIGAAFDSFAAPLSRFLSKWRYALIALVALAQAGVLIHMIVGRERVLAHGQQIDLTVVPVDPRDFFRGDYVTLRYDISTLQSQIVADKVSRGDAIQVRLIRKDGVWQPAAAAKSGLKGSGPDEVVIAGRVTYVQSETGVGPGDVSVVYVSVVYGIEKFFVPEGTGREIEDNVRQKAVIAHVAVDAKGVAALKGLTVSGQRYDMPPLF